MIHKFKESVYSKLIQYGDGTLWNNRVFRKLKLYGILPDYIEREKAQSFSRIKDVAYVEDLQFKFGFRKDINSSPSGELMSAVNIGVVHEIEVEFANIGTLVGDFVSGNCSIYLQDNGLNKELVYSLNSGAYTHTDTVTITEYYNVLLIQRNHQSVTIKINNIVISQFTLTQDLDFIFNYISSSGISNGYVKVSQEDKILHWWKYNNFDDDIEDPSGVSQYIGSEDAGLNSKGFYGLWYSIIQIFGWMQAYVNKFLQINSDDFLIKRFLTKKGLAYDNSLILNDTDNGSFTYLYENWINEYKKRGTYDIIAPINPNTGIIYDCISQEWSWTLYGDAISLGKFYTVEFDWTYNSTMEYMTGTTVGTMFYGMKCNGAINNLVKFINFNDRIAIQFFNNQVVTLYKEVDIFSNRLSRIKIIRENAFYLIYVDEVLKYRTLVAILTNTDDEISKYDIYSEGTFMSGTVGIIANINIHLKDSYSIKFNFETYSYRIGVQLLNVSDSVTINPNIGYKTLGISEQSPALFFPYSLLAENLKYYPIGGELLRLINRKESSVSPYFSYDTEFVFAMNSNIGWTLNTSSPCQRQTYPIKGYNKFNNQDKEIKDLSKIPLGYGGVASVQYLESLSVEKDTDNLYKLKITPRNLGGGTVTSYGIYPGNPSQPETMHYSYRKIFIPVSDSLDYEISFRVKTQNTGIIISFGATCYDGNGQLLTPKSAYSGVDSEYRFMTRTPIQSAEMLRLVQRIAAVDHMWIRGILYNKDNNYDSSRMNINYPLGRNLIMQEGTRFIAPEILIFNSSNINPIYLWDIQVRPLNGNVDKGSLDVKNLISMYYINNTQLSNKTIIDKVENELIPYNCTIKEKLLPKPIAIPSQDPLVTAFINAYNIIATNEISALEGLVSKLRGNGTTNGSNLINKIYTIYVLLGSDLNKAVGNLMNPGVHDLTFPLGGNIDASGFNADGVTYATSGFNMSTDVDMVNNGWGRFMYVSSGVPNSNAESLTNGWDSSLNQPYGFVHGATTASFYIASQTLAAQFTNISSGLFHATGKAGGRYKSFKDGVLTLSPLTDLVPNNKCDREINWFARQYNNNTDKIAVTAVVRIMGDTYDLTATEGQDFYEAITEFITRL